MESPSFPERDRGEDFIRILSCIITDRLETQIREEIVNVMTNTFVDKLKQEMIWWGIAAPDEIVGCTPYEVDSVVAAQRVNALPELYIEFLLAMGRKAGNFLVGADFLYPKLLELKEYAYELLYEEGATFQLPDDTFIFLVHQGYQFFYFRTRDQAADPRIYYYIEGSRNVLEKGTLAAFLTKSVEDHKEVILKSSGKDSDKSSP